MIANTLIHREYTSSFQAKFVIEKDQMYVENANRSAQICVITPENIEPNPKNPIIASFFRNIGYAEQLGSGVRNLFKYSKFYSGKEPEFIEDDIFRIIVPLQDNYLDSYDYISTQSAEKTTQSTTRLRIIKVGEDITELMRQEPELSQKQIAERLRLNVNTVKYYIKKMQEQGKIRHTGSSRKGKWIISD